MIRSMIMLAFGIYAGIWLAQNHDVPQVETPKDLYDRAKDWLTGKSQERQSGDEYDDGGGSYRS